jgi:hypothetical protein
MLRGERRSFPPRRACILARCAVHNARDGRQGSFRKTPESRFAKNMGHEWGHTWCCAALGFIVQHKETAVARRQDRVDAPVTSGEGSERNGFFFFLREAGISRPASNAGARRRPRERLGAFSVLLFAENYVDLRPAGLRCATSEEAHMSHQTPLSGWRETAEVGFTTFRFGTASTKLKYEES